ncbi:MAG: hypothetical protein JW862_09615 [Anaerolineales bacterium]|nr:hypothetical protein [Anaerolineales bacterium]
MSIPTDQASLRQELAGRLAILPTSLEPVNAVLSDPGNRLVSDFLDVVLKYGTPQEINRQAQEASQLPVLLDGVRRLQPDYIDALDWLRRQQAAGAFISLPNYRRKILGERFLGYAFDERYAVTLELSACQYFPWLIEIAQRALENGEIMPARIIRVRNMQEQEADGDLVAFAAAMQIIGASYVEQLDRRGSDGANIHLGGADTLIGYYGGVGEPNDYALLWLDEFLYFYTRYGIRQVLNVNNGTVLLAYFLHRLGIDIEFKISVTLGNDNPYSAFWILMTASLFSRPDGSTPLVGFNWSNSVENETIQIAAQFRRQLGLEELVRFEHHVTETWKGLVIQPYDRRANVLELAQTVANISAKHEGGEPAVEARRARPSDINDYFREKAEVIASGEWPALTLNFLDKFDSLNLTAQALTEQGLAFSAARHLHSR